MSEVYETMRDDEFYSFIEEKIKTPEEKKKKKIILRVAAFIGAAVFFGAIASVIFSLMQIYVFKTNNSTEKIVLSQMTTPQPTTQTTTKSSKYNYTRLKKLKDQMKYTLVTVSCNKDSVDFLSNPNVKSSDIYGIIVAKTDKEVMIMTDAKNTIQSATVDVSFDNTSLINAEVKSYDSDLRIAILSVASNSVASTIYDKLTPVNFSSTSDISTGEEIVVAGNPTGIPNSIDLCSVTTNSVYRYFTDGRVRLFYTDAVYSSKGEGVALDFDGQLLGIITHQFDLTTDSESCKFMGIRDIKSCIEKLVNGEALPYVGIIGTDLANEIGLAGRIYVTEVKVKSPAYQAGVLVGDEITMVGETSVTNMASYYECIQRYKPGDKVDLTVVSGGGSPKVLSITITKK